MKRTQQQQKKPDAIILGVDPGTLRTGYGIIALHQQTPTLVAYDVVQNFSRESMTTRLKRIYDTLCAVIQKYRPDEFAIETAFFGKNIQSALKIGHARGVALLAAVQYEIPTTEYSPREVKRAVTGNGGASKQQVQYMVKSQLRLRNLPKYFDVTDALAVALCHSFRHGGGRVVSFQKNNSWEQFVRQHPERVVKLK